MGISSELTMPSGHLQTNNAFALGWFLLFEKKDFFRLEPSENSEIGLDGFIQIGFQTSIKNAKILLNKRMEKIKSDYFKGCFLNINDLNEMLENSPPAGMIKLNCSEWAINLYKDDIEDMIRDLKTFSEKMITCLVNEDYDGFNEINEIIGDPNFKASGNLIKDKDSYEKNTGSTIKELIIGFET
jgi:hypothetical protein